MKRLLISDDDNNNDDMISCDNINIIKIIQMVSQAGKEIDLEVDINKTKYNFIRM